MKAIGLTEFGGPDVSTAGNSRAPCQPAQTPPC
jgi:hypothetical protein